MLYESLLLIATNLLAFIMVFIVMLSRTVEERLRLTLIATILSLVFWQDTIFIADNSAHDLILWNTIIFFWPTAAILSCFAFIRALHRSQTRKVQRSRMTIPMLMIVLVQLIPIVTINIFSAATKTNAGLELERSTGYYVYLAGLIISLALLVTEIIVRRRRSGHGSLERYAINVVLATVIIASTYGVIINAIVPLLTGGQSYIGFGVIIIDIFAIGLSLSIARGHLIDIRFYAVRTTVYILSLATLAVVYAVIAYLVSQWILGFGASSLQNFINIALALLLAFIFQPIRHFFDRVTNRIFYRDEIDSDTFFSHLNQELTTTNDIRDLMRRTATFIADALKSEQAFFFVFHGDRAHIQAGTEYHQKFAAQDAREVGKFIHGKDMIVASDLATSNRSLYRLMLSNRIAVVLPLRRDGIGIGYFVLGEHRQGAYTRRDIRLLGTVADELSIAVQNALSVQEVKDVNSHLEQRIDSATKELRASNAQLQKLDEAKDEFISMASHQLRTPLTSIKGYISMLSEGDVGKITDEQKHILDEAFISSERMVRLIGDFLNVSRLQTGKFIIDKHPADLGKIVAQEIDGLETNASARNLKFTYKQPKKFPELNIDESKIRQVIMNFSDNAIYYSKDNSSIKVSLKISGEYAEFTVKDTGIGVPDAEKDQLFNKFFRATNARKQRPDGTGVGLFLAKKVIDAHHGQIIFESKEGKGSTFGFRLPLAKLRVTSDTK